MHTRIPSRSAHPRRRPLRGAIGGALVSLICGLSMLPATVAGEPVPQAAPPNILLIVAEDMSPRAGAYGDPVAITPNIDNLANRGIRFDHAFTVSGVCAPSRSSLITGVYATSMGTHQMRTGQGVPGSAIEAYEAVPPVAVKAFPELLRAAGYATANFAKTDYQFGNPFTIWDLNAGGFMSDLEPALWRKLPDDKPFFVMVNLMATHESRLAESDADYRGPSADTMAALAAWQSRHVKAITDPDAVVVPPYYPDTDRVRRSMAQHYDNIHFMDTQVGEILAALEADGLSDDTIVIFTTDHGDGFPRAKRSVYDSGIHVPLVIRFPDGRRAGENDTRLVSFVDLAPTILTLAGAPVPAFVQGVNFLDGGERDIVFAARDRMDATVDRQRAARSARFKYIRNGMPELSYFRPLAFRDRFPIMEELWANLAQEKLNARQRYYFTAPRPVEELYDLDKDPWEVDNLAQDPAYSEALTRMRNALGEWIATVGDRGTEPELDMVRSMWPDLRQPQTASPAIEVSAAAAGDALRFSISSDTPGASTGYRLNGGPWQVYTGPVSVERGSRIEAMAVRYGYRPSDIASADSPPRQ